MSSDLINDKAGQKEDHVKDGGIDVDLILGTQESRRTSLADNGDDPNEGRILIFTAGRHRLTLHAYD
jgi:hypothetical protein